MGFLNGLKGGKVPGELPDLAIDTPRKVHVEESPKEVLPERIPDPIPTVVRPRPVISPQPQNLPIVEKKEEIHNELVFEDPEQTSETEVRSVAKEAVEKIDVGELSKESYFDEVLEDINGEIEDLGNLEEWYNKKFLPQDVVSNMRGFWEGNKSEIIIKSFGSDYKKKINEKIARMGELEMDWREIYFRLVKKEEEMKKEERELKEILSEFVELCKLRGKPDGESKSKKS